MTIVRRPSPFGELLSLRQAMDRLFEDSFVRPGRYNGFGGFDGGLPMDVRTTKDALVVEASLPGYSADEVEISVENGTLSITAQASGDESQEEGEYLLHEIRRGQVTRAITLPQGLEPDRASANFENGVLTLRIPKAEQVKPRQIKINPTTHGTLGSGDTDSPEAGQG